MPPGTLLGDADFEYHYYGQMGACSVQQRAQSPRAQYGDFGPLDFSGWVVCGAPGPVTINTQAVLWSNTSGTLAWSPVAWGSHPVVSAWVASSTGSYRKTPAATELPQIRQDVTLSLPRDPNTRWASWIAPMAENGCVAPDQWTVQCRLMSSTFPFIPEAPSASCLGWPAPRHCSFLPRINGCEFYVTVPSCGPGAVSGVVGEGPRLTVSGRLRTLAEKELYADDYQMNIDAQPRTGPLGSLVGVKSIEVSVDGQSELYAQQTCPGCAMSRSFTFAGRARQPGTHRIEVTAIDELGARAGDSWTVNRSDFDTLPYEAEFIRDAKEWRSTFGLRADDAWVEQTIHEPAYVPSRRRNNFPVSPEEEQQMEQDDQPRPENVSAESSATSGASTESQGGAAASSGARYFNPQGVFNYAEYWWNKTRGRPFQRFDNDCTNFVSQAWHFGGGVSMTKGWYIKRKNTPLNPFDSNRSWAHSWSIVPEFVNYMVDKRRLAVKFRTSPANRTHGGRMGDAIMYDWGRGGGWSHLGVALGKQGTTYDRISQHTPDRWSSDWNLGWQRERNKVVRGKMKAMVIQVPAVRRVN